MFLRFEILAEIELLRSPHLSASHPHSTSFPPPAVSFSE